MNGALGLSAVAFVAVLLAAVALRAATVQVTVVRARRRTGGSRLSARIPVCVAALVPVGLFATEFPKLLVVLIPAVAVAVPLARTSIAARARRRYQRELPEVMEHVAGGIRSGAGLLIAIENAAETLTGPVARDMAIIGAEVRHGRSLEQALIGWAARVKSQEVRLVASSLSLAHRSGAAHGRVIDAVVQTLRRSMNASAIARTHATQSRASAWALSLMPIVFTGTMAVADSNVRAFLFDTWPGVTVLAVGLLLDGLGALWMARLVQRAAQW